MSDGTGITFCAYFYTIHYTKQESKEKFVEIPHKFPIPTKKVPTQCVPYDILLLSLRKQRGEYIKINTKFN